MSLQTAEPFTMAPSPQSVPRHVAIIMDGNRRWAKQRNLPSFAGHWEGAEVLTEVVKAASDMGIQTLTVYAFSTENWGRSPEEVEALIHLFEVYLAKKEAGMIKDGIRLGTIGDMSRFPQPVRASFERVKQSTAHCKKINLVLAVNYGGRDEIRRAFVRIVEDHKEHKLDPTTISEALIASYLDTTPYGDPDLLIRTSGELRLSNFLLWQMSYCELFSTDVMWPDFTSHHLLEAVKVFQSRHRRHGVSVG
ncbi:MAG: undecaprenyl pyrophosphate synthase [Chlamydiota bacterium]|jgi:undecaprenyl diphosphate synthase